MSKPKAEHIHGSYKIHGDTDDIYLFNLGVKPQPYYNTAHTNDMYSFKSYRARQDSSPYTHKPFYNSQSASDIYNLNRPNYHTTISNDTIAKQLVLEQLEQLPDNVIENMVQQVTKVFAQSIDKDLIQSLLTLNLISTEEIDAIALREQQKYQGGGT